MILVQVLPLQRRIQVLELNANTPLAQSISLGQVIVNLVLGLEQVILVVVVIVSVPTMVIVAVSVVMVFAVTIFMIILSVPFSRYSDNHKEEDPKRPHFVIGFTLPEFQTIRS